MSLPIRLLVGLGNPGAQYEATRHNAGFWIVDHFADDLHARFAENRSLSAQVAAARHGGQAVWLAKPTTFMNESGRAVGALARFYKLAPEQILVVHDELDLPPGSAKLKFAGGHAGHNGLRDIQRVLGSAAFWRLRIGMGHPRDLGLAQPVVQFVLHPPRRDDLPAIDDVVARCRAVLPLILDGDLSRATEQLHQGNPHA